MPERRPHSFVRVLPWAGLVAGMAMLALATFQKSPPAADPAAGATGEYIVVRHILLAGEPISRPDGDSPESVSAQYLVNKHLWAAGSMPVPVAYNAAGEPAGIDGAQIVKDSIDKWTAVSPATFSFTWTGASSGGPGACENIVERDSINTITFVNDLPYGVLGQTCTVWPASGGSAAALVEFDMQLNSTANWSAAATTPVGHYDIWSTVLHELGHAAGLGHTTNSAGVMYATLKAAYQKRTLTEDDREGLFAAYPGAPPTPVPSPTAQPTPNFPRNFAIRAPLIARD